MAYDFIHDQSGYRTGKIGMEKVQERFVGTLELGRVAERDEVSRRTGHGVCWRVPERARPPAG